MNHKMDDFTVKYLRIALFENKSIQIDSSPVFNDLPLSWDDPTNLNTPRKYEKNDTWNWNIKNNKITEGISWGGCLESINEMIRFNVPIPSLDDFDNIILLLETSEMIPDSKYVANFIDLIGKLKILSHIKGILVGRPKAQEYDNPKTEKITKKYRLDQIETIITNVRKFNSNIPIVQNLDFGHTAPQICMPVGRKVIINSDNREILIEF